MHPPHCYLMYIASGMVKRVANLKISLKLLLNNFERCDLFAHNHFDNCLQFRALFGAVLHDGGTAEAEKEDKQGLFPLHIAAQNLLPDAVCYLLSCGADVNKKSMHGQG